MAPTGAYEPLADGGEAKRALKRQATSQALSKSFKGDAEVVAQAPLGKTSYEVLPSGAIASAVTIVHDTSGQHTIAWEQAIVCELRLPDQTQHHVSVPAGEANLYQFPLCHLARMKAGRTEALEGEELEALCQLVLALAAQPGCAFMNSFDFFGALPLHGLLIKNSPASLALALRLVRSRPDYLAQKHAPWSPFDGENTLHVVAVNQQEELLIEFVQLAAAHLSRAQLEDLFCARLDPCAPGSAGRQSCGCTSA